MGPNANNETKLVLDAFCIFLESHCQDEGLPRNYCSKVPSQMYFTKNVNPM